MKLAPSINAGTVATALVLCTGIVAMGFGVYRAEGNALGCGTHWVMAALITNAFPLAVSRVPAGWVFLFFCAMMVLQLLWVLTMVPETKGVSLEEIQRWLVGTDVGSDQITATGGNSR